MASLKFSLWLFYKARVKQFSFFTSDGKKENEKEKFKKFPTKFLLFIHIKSGA